MSNWLEKALGREETEPVQSVPFSLTCQCGFQIEGQRQERAKRVVCSECGVCHFILPINRYPISDRSFLENDNSPSVKPQPPKPKTKPPVPEVDLEDDPVSQDEGDDLFIDEDHQKTEPQLDLVEAAWSNNDAQPEYDDDVYDDDDGDDYELADSDAEIELPPELTRSKKREKLSLPPAEQKKKRKKKSKVPVANEERSKEKLQLVGVCILIFVAVGTMVAFAIQGWRRDRAEVAMRNGRDLGEAALKERDFSTARQHLREAVRAMELLELDDETKAQTRNLWLQAEAGFGLLDSTDVVEIAMLAQQLIPEPDDEGNVDDEDWQRQFRTQFFDRWLCIQLASPAVITGGDEFGRRVVFPASPLVHLAGVDAVLEGSSDGVLWFAGPLKSCQRDPIDETAWLVEFDATRVIACDRTQSLVLPMLSDEEQKAIAAELAAESAPIETQDNDQVEPNDE